MIGGAALPSTALRLTWHSAFESGSGGLSGTMLLVPHGPSAVCAAELGAESLGRRPAFNVDAPHAGAGAAVPSSARRLGALEGCS